MAYNSVTQVLSSTNGISLSEVAKCLSVGTLDLGSLCTSDNIKMWSRHKPIRHSTKDVLTDAQKKALNYGLVPAYALQGGQNTGTSNFAELFTNEYPWSYNKPRGGEFNEPFRLTDFVSSEQSSVGYCHKCEFPPIYAKEYCEASAASGMTGNVYSQYGSNVSEAISYQDLGEYSNWYLAIAIVVPNTSGTNPTMPYYYFYKTSDYPIGTGITLRFTKDDAAVIAEAASAGPRTYDFYLFLTNTPSSNNGSNKLHLYNTTSSGFDPAGALFLPLLYDDINQTKGTIRIISAAEGDADLTISIGGVVGSYVSSYIPFPPDWDKYTGGYPDLGINPQTGMPYTLQDSVYDQYFMPITRQSGTMSIKLSIANTGTVQKSFTVSNLRVKITQSLSNTIQGNSPLLVTPTIITEDGGNVSTLTIPGETVKNVILSLPVGTLLKNSSNVEDPNINTTYNRKYFNASIIRVSSGSEIPIKTIPQVRIRYVG